MIPKETKNPSPDFGAWNFCFGALSLAMILTTA